MAENKSKIIVYRDWINTFEALQDDEAGKLIKHFFRYINDLNPEAPDRLTQLLFEPIKQTLKRDLQKYNCTCQNNSKNALKKWGATDNINSAKRSERLSVAREKGTHTKEEWDEMVSYFNKCVKCEGSDKIVKDHIIPIYQGGSDGIINLQPLCQKCNSSKGPDNKDYRIDYCKRNACKMPAKWVRTPTKPTDSDSDSDSDIIIEDLYNNIAIYFDEDCRPKTEEQKKQWLDTLEKLIRIDGYSPEQIQNIIKRTRMDDFWRTNFLSVLKLRKKNKEGIMYFTVFEKKMNHEATFRNNKAGATPEQLAAVVSKHFGEE